MQFHINPQTKNTGKCRAEQGKCPFGATAAHYDSEAEAQHHAEKMLEQQFPESTNVFKKSAEEQAARDWADRLRAEKNTVFSQDARAEQHILQQQAQAFENLPYPGGYLYGTPDADIDQQYGAGAADRFKSWHAMNGDYGDALVMEQQVMTFKRMHNPDVFLQSFTPEQIDTIWGFNAHARFEHWQHGGKVADTAPNEANGKGTALKRAHYKKQFNQETDEVLAEIQQATTKIGKHFNPKHALFTTEQHGNVILHYPVRQPLPQSQQHGQRKGVRAKTSQSRPAHITSWQRYPLGKHPMVAQALVKFPAKMTTKLLKKMLKTFEIKL